MNLYFLIFNLLSLSKIYEFNYYFFSNIDNRMFINYKNNKYRESVIVNNQQGRFLLDSNSNNFSYNFRNNNINDFFFNFFEKKGDKILYSNKKYDNKIIKKNFYDKIEYNSTKKHYIEIYFGINFLRLSNSSLYFNVYNNNNIIKSDLINTNYINYYKKYINNCGKNIITIEIINKEKNIINCVTCDNGYLFSYYFNLLKTNLKEEKIYHYKNNNFKFSDLLTIQK